MSTNAEVELARVREKFAPMDLRSILGWSALVVAMVIASRFKHVDWYFFAGMMSAPVIWEFTKFRLRRNAEGFARASRQL